MNIDDWIKFIIYMASGLAVVPFTLLKALKVWREVRIPPLLIEKLGHHETKIRNIAERVDRIEKDSDSFSTMPALLLEIQAALHEQGKTLVEKVAVQNLAIEKQNRRIDDVEKAIDTRIDKMHSTCNATFLLVQGFVEKINNETIVKVHPNSIPRPPAKKK